MIYNSVNYIVAALIALGMFAAPSMSYAQLVTCSGTDCNFCDIVEMVDGLIVWSVGFLVLIAVILFVVAGFRLVTSGGDQGAASAAKATLTNVVIGFIIILAAWLIVDTVLELLTDKGGIDEWGLVSCGGMFEPKETAMDEIPVGPSGVEVIAGVGGEGLSEAEARALLESVGIPFKTGEAAATFNGLRPHVIGAVSTLARDCNCNPLITEATGGVHAVGTYSHANGYKLDLRTRDNPALVEHVRRLPPAGSWKDGTQLYYDAKTCGTYAIESDHIDVVYKPNCSNI